MKKTTKSLRQTYIIESTFAPLFTCLALDAQDAREKFAFGNVTHYTQWNDVTVHEWNAGAR
jgi:hypothetical protein